MEKWPERQEHTDDCWSLEGMCCDCGATQFNACHDAFMKVINEQPKLEPLDNQAVLYLLLLVKPVEIMTFNEIDLKKMSI